VHVLQVRPIAVTHSREPIDDADVARALADAGRVLRERNAPSPTLLGATTRYSVMTDWNPAEIVGTNPKRLALSLYRHLVTDEVWARQRAEYGYRDVRPCPLLVDFVGHPYVDVRASFNSFVPAALPRELARELVDAYLANLADHPELHDKVEFDVVVGTVGDSWDRYYVRMEEMRQSVRILEQLIEGIPEGPHMTVKYGAKIKVPEGTYYSQLETARGVLGIFLVSDGKSDAPYRLHFRSPNFSNLWSITAIAPGWRLADIIAIQSSLDLVIPDIDR
jgi:hypothetical protein